MKTSTPAASVYETASSFAVAVGEAVIAVIPIDLQFRARAGFLREARKIAKNPAWVGRSFMALDYRERPFALVTDGFKATA